MPVHRNIGGTWKQGNLWRNIGGTWKQGNLWRNIGGAWKNLSTVFTPDGGSVSDENIDSSSVTLSCSTPATWTYSGGGTGGTVSVANGGTANNITFTVTSQFAGAGNTTTRSRTWNVTGVSNGITRTFTVTCTADGNGGNL